MGPYYHGKNENGIFRDELCVYKDKDFFYANLLLKAIKEENLEKVKWLLVCMKTNPNLLFPKIEMSSMHKLAAMKNEHFSVEVMHLALQECNGDPNLRSKDGLTPVHLAAMRGRCQVLEILLKFGGDPDLAEYKMNLNAEDIALRKHQWQAHATLVTFAIMNGNENPETCVDRLPCNSVKRDECEHELLLKKLRRLFTDHGELDDRPKFLVKEGIDWYDEANPSSRPTSGLNNETKATQTPLTKHFKDGRLKTLEKIKAEPNLKKYNRANQQKSKIPTNSQTRSEELTDFCQNGGSLSKLKINTKALVKTTTNKMSQSYQLLRVKNTYFQQKESRGRRSTLLLASEKCLEHFQLAKVKLTSAC